jgi:long-chain-fatty-acid--[acyl-carrier-protein] ligase
LKETAMLRVLRYLLCKFAQGTLSLRYRIRVHGLENVRNLEGPLLILPNHPAYIDPAIVLSTLYPVLHPRPLLYEGNFQNPVLYPVMLLLDALRVPDLEQASEAARQRTEEAIAGIKDSLRRGENVILWPSGRVQRTPIERLGASRTVSEVLRDVPQAKVVLVRTRGLWGSRFSYAWSGTKPPFLKRAFQGLGYILANLIFFAPRRQMSLTLEHIDRSQLPGLQREALNPWLEKWFNVGAPEQPTFVPAHFFFGPRTHEYPRIEAQETLDLSKVTPQTIQAVNEMVVAKLGRPLPDGAPPDTALDHLGLDSLTRQELSLDVERRFGFTGDQVPATLGQLYALASGQVRRQPPKPPAPLWFQKPQQQEAAILGDTIPEAFVNRVLLNRQGVVTADDRAGVLTYERLLVGALVMARRFRDLPGDNVGVLLPSSVGCDIALMGLYLAGKLPVVLNWTTGPAALEHAARTMSLQHVITAKAFVDRVGVKVPGASWIFLEEMSKQIGRIEKLLTLLKVRWLPGLVRNGVPRPAPDSPAVVLFTSGSEKAPKAVPLTHHNLLTVLKSGTELLKVTRKDSILGFLPAFHSFGMTITGLYPILAGLRVVRHPDPTDAAILARKIGAYKPTILVGTPTFVSYILERAEPGELTSLRMVIVGAEKCPAMVFEKMAEASPGVKVLEGYGITECSPVVSVNPPDANRPGTVGKPLPGVEVSVIDLEAGMHWFATGETEAVSRARTLPPGEMGMLLVAGPTVFPGYLGYSGASPFCEREGKRWYVTGDLVQIDRDGYIHFAGRLKRFLKAGGEMISLPALEEPFARLYPPDKDGPRVAVEGVEMEGGGRRIVLFTTEDISLARANDILLREGFHGVMRLDEVRRVEKLPVLGTGKTDYKILRAQIQSTEPAEAVR